MTKKKLDMFIDSIEDLVFKTMAFPSPEKYEKTMLQVSKEIYRRYGAEPKKKKKIRKIF